MALFGNKVSNLMENRKIDREIADLESKKQALVKSVTNDIKHLQAQITEKYTEIGANAYSAHTVGKFSEELFTQSFNEITMLKSGITEKEAKIMNIVDRYNDEIALMRNLNQGSSSTPPSTRVASASIPGNTSASIPGKANASIPGNASASIPDFASASIPDFASANIPGIAGASIPGIGICDICDTQYNDGDTFCKECGNKLK